MVFFELFILITSFYYLFWIGNLFIDFFIWHNFSLLKLQGNDLKPIQYFLGRKIY